MRENVGKLFNGARRKRKFHKKWCIQKRSLLNNRADNRRPALHPPKSKQHPPRHKTLQHISLQIIYCENRRFRVNKKFNRLPNGLQTRISIFRFPFLPVFPPSTRRSPNPLFPTTFQPEFLCLWDIELRVSGTTVTKWPKIIGFQIWCLFTWPCHFLIVFCHDYQNGDHVGIVECE